MLDDPKAESPIEQLWSRALRKVLSDEWEYHSQVPYETVCGTFRVDQMVTNGRHRIAFECDGKDFHDSYRDEWRDAMLLGDGKVSRIIRLRGSDITHHLDDCVYIVWRLCPSLLSERGRTNVNLLANDVARDVLLNPGGMTWAVYPDTNFTISVTCRDAAIPAGERRMWQGYYEFAQQNPSDNLDEVMAKWSERWKSNRVTKVFGDEAE